MKKISLKQYNSFGIDVKATNLISIESRSIFQEHFPSKTAAKTVPSVPSVACSTPIAIEWDKSFKNLNDPSGRSILNVHNDSY